MWFAADVDLEYRTREFWDEVEIAFDRLHADPAAWDDFVDEVRNIHGTPNAELLAEPPSNTEDATGHKGLIVERRIRGEPESRRAACG